MRAGLDAVLSVVLASSCTACGELLEHPTRGPVCEVCWRSIRPITPPVCDRCGDPLPAWRLISVGLAQCPRCRRARPIVDRARAIGEYDGALRAVIHALKYEVGVPVVHALRRLRPTATQTDLPAARRHRNVRSAFGATRHARAIAGSVIVLVDDVSTTGATLDACARVLKDAGALEVRALTAARVVTGRR
ncbi:MAG: hypothetical protein DMG04_09465 [Acidobacteria bacterium]|nr:MAG: hypothetical protein DMG04_09465 [Acidobacteriota bacterium]